RGHQTASRGSTGTAWGNESRYQLIELCARHGLTDIQQIMSYTYNELIAVLKGLSYRQIDIQELLAQLAINFRIANHKKKLKVNDVFNRRKLERKVEKAFNSGDTESVDADLAARIQIANEHFANKFKGKGE
ncbi:hypothetical protein QP149_25530, partial [Escherichia coli]|nr:hypothetical protein [Escherichia coli]